jgi:hypothetical protein
MSRPANLSCRRASARGVQFHHRHRLLHRRYQRRPRFQSPAHRERIEHPVCRRSGEHGLQRGGISEHLTRLSAQLRFRFPLHRHRGGSQRDGAVVADNTLWLFPTSGSGAAGFLSAGHSIDLYQGTARTVAQPSAPANLTAIGTSAKIGRSWSAVNGVTNCTLQRAIDFGTTNHLFFSPRAGSATARFAIRTPAIAEQVIDGPEQTAVGGWTHVAVTPSARIDGTPIPRGGPWHVPHLWC